MLPTWTVTVTPDPHPSLHGHRTEATNARLPTGTTFPKNRANEPLKPELGQIRDANPADAETPILPLALCFAEEPLKILKQLIPQRRRKRKITLITLLYLGQALHTREAIFTILKMHRRSSRVRRRLLHSHSHTPAPAPWGFVSREWPFQDEWWEKRQAGRGLGWGRLLLCLNKQKKWLEFHLCHWMVTFPNLGGDIL